MQSRIHRQNRWDVPSLMGGASVGKACLAVALGLWAVEGFAAQTANEFQVRVKYQLTAPVPPPPNPGPGGGSGPGGGGAGGGGSGNGIGNGLCLNTTSADAFGAYATVVCSTGALVDISPGSRTNPWFPMHGGAFRYVTQVFWNGDWLDSIDDSQGMGTVTSWRRVNLVNRQYLELTVGW